MKTGQIKLVLTSCDGAGLQVPPQRHLFHSGEMLFGLKAERPVHSSLRREHVDKLPKARPLKKPLLRT